ncbi:MAG TPA: hypothetical protein VIM19_07890 [Actinomycetes bacterium]
MPTTDRAAELAVPGTPLWVTVVLWYGVDGLAAIFAGSPVRGPPPEEDFRATSSGRLKSFCRV